MQYLEVNEPPYSPGMDVYECRRLRLAELLKEFSAIELSRRSGIAATTISRYKSEPDAKGHKRMTEENARKLEAAGRKPPHWLDRQHWTPAQHIVTGSERDPVDRELSDPAPIIDPTTLTWESVVQSLELPSRFKLAVPDDALAPTTPKGVILIFSTELRPAVGTGVLVQDETGRRYIRMFAEGPGGTWIAAARAEGYLSLDSRQHQLRILAVVEAKVDGRV